MLGIRWTDSVTINWQFYAGITLNLFNINWFLYIEYVFDQKHDIIILEILRYKHGGMNTILKATEISFKLKYC